jgi:phage terminase large subunit
LRKVTTKLTNPTFKIPGKDEEYCLAEALARLGKLDGTSFEQFRVGEEIRRKKDAEKYKGKYRGEYMIQRESHKRAKRYLTMLGVDGFAQWKMIGERCKLDVNYVNALESLALGAKREVDISNKLQEDAVKEHHAQKIIDNLLEKEQSPDIIVNSKTKKPHEVILTGKEDYQNIQLVRDPVIKFAMLKALERDIPFFVKKVLQATPTPHQKQLFEAFQEEDARISVRSAHGTGKSCSLAWLIIHSLLFIPNVRILCTAPSAPQMYDVLWSELKYWRSRMGSNWWKKQIRITQSRAEFVANTSNTGNERIIDNANRFATARTARKDNPVALQGLHAHAGQMIILVDEASGVPNEVYEVGEGALTSKNSKVVMMSNPTTSDPENYFFRSHNKHRKFWNCLHFSAIDSPLVDDNWIQEEKDKYGEESPIFQFRVLGEFPKLSDDILIPLHFVESAWGRDIKAFGAERICGVDPARFGEDQTGVVIRQGSEIIHIEKWAKFDTMYTAARVADLYKDGRFDICAVDTIGLGAGVADRLKQLIGTDKVLEVNVAERPAAREQFNRLRDELWWCVREFFEKRSAAFNTDTIEKKMFDEILGELCSIKYAYQGNGKRKVQSKDELKKDGRRSPNLADALCLTFINEVSGETPVTQQFPGVAHKVVSAPHNGAIVG